MRTLLCNLCLFCSLGLSAQLGVLGGVNVPTIGDISLPGQVIEGESFAAGPEVAVNYWFRLPKQRVEFLPTLYWTRNTVARNSERLYFDEVGALMKVNVYPFDFVGDCDCPTFGKQGPQLEKGFYLQLAGGYALQEMVFTETFQGTVVFGGGVGIDFGISNLITLTPQLNVRKSVEPFTTQDLTDGGGNPGAVAQPGLLTYQVGLQATFRFDHKRF